MATRPGSDIDSPYPPARILSLDGGGVRGISSLYILKEIMAQVRRQWNQDHPYDIKIEEFLPAEYFDLICGTSTGGLIALMVGRLRMTVSDAITRFTEMSKAIFASGSDRAEAAFDHRVLERSIKEVIASSPLELDPECDLQDEGGTPTFVISTRLRGTGSSPVRMRTYGSDSFDVFQAKIWQAARATSAAPTFFDPIVIDGTIYGDGGLGWNNPTREAFTEVHKIWPNRPIGCVVSIGTGLEDPVQLVNANSQVQNSFVRWVTNIVFPGSAFKIAVAEYCVRSSTSCEQVHEELDSNLARYELENCYFRLNVPQGMSRIGLEEYDKLEDIKALTDSYLSGGNCDRMKEQVARIILKPESTVMPPQVARERDQYGRTALHRAALTGNIREIRTQMDIGADLDAQEGIKSYTPLICAITMGHLEACQALLAFGADVNKSDVNRWTPLIHSINSLSGGLDSTTFAVYLLEEPGIDINYRDNQNRTALFHAALRCMHHLVIEMIRRGATVDVRDAQGKTALYFAVLSECIPALKALCDAGAEIDIQDNNLSQTPLHWASRLDLATATSWLLEHGASRDILDNEGKTALQVAQDANATRCIDLLRAHTLTIEPKT